MTENQESMMLAFIVSREPKTTGRIDYMTDKTFNEKLGRQIKGENYEMGTY